MNQYISPQSKNVISFYTRHFRGGDSFDFSVHSLTIPDLLHVALTRNEDRINTDDETEGKHPVRAIR